MSDGRSFWWAKDSVWWDRTRIVKITNQHGAIGGAALDWLCCHAKQINDAGRVKSGYEPVAKAIGELNSVDRVEAAIRFAAKIGAIDEFVELDQWTFTGRISGWAADQESARSALRQAAARAREAEAAAKEALRCVTESNGMLDSVTLTEPNRRTTTKGAIRGQEVEAVFEAWKDSTGHADARLGAKRKRLIENALKMYPMADLVDAVDGWRFSRHHRGENDRATVYNDLGLVLRNEENIERFMGYKRDNGSKGGSSAIPESLLNPRGGDDGEN